MRDLNFGAFGFEVHSPAPSAINLAAKIRKALTPVTPDRVAHLVQVDQLYGLSHRPIPGSDDICQVRASEGFRAVPEDQGP